MEAYEGMRPLDLSIRAEHAEFSKFIVFETPNIKRSPKSKKALRGDERVTLSEFATPTRNANSSELVTTHHSTHQDSTKGEDGREDDGEAKEEGYYSSNEGIIAQPDSPRFQKYNHL